MKPQRNCILLILLVWLCERLLANPIMPSFTQLYPHMSIVVILTILVVEFPFVYVVLKTTIKHSIIVTILINALSAIAGFVPALRIGDALNAFPQYTHGGYLGIASFSDWLHIIITALLIGIIIEAVAIAFIKKKIKPFDIFIVASMNIASYGAVLIIKLFI